jgi:hypothetical protein
MWAAVILHYLDRRYKLLLWGRGPAIADSLDQPDLCIFAESVLGRSIEFDALPMVANIGLLAARRASAVLPAELAGAAARLPLVDIARLRARDAAQYVHQNWVAITSATLDASPCLRTTLLSWRDLYEAALVGRFEGASVVA